jgi:hypothetical protein
MKGIMNPRRLFFLGVDIIPGLWDAFIYGAVDSTVGDVHYCLHVSVDAYACIPWYINRSTEFNSVDV